jgi:isopentenyl-diphosphate delta-isomerase
MNENIVIVDIFDNEIGYGEKLETHVREKLHRAFSLFIVRENKILIQKRAEDKYHSGGLWANSCCSHHRYGKDFDTSVRERVKEELGIDSEKFDYKELFTFIYYAKFDKLAEYEYDHVLISDYSGEITPNESEMSEIRWIDVETLKKELEDEPQKFSSWFLICAPKVIEYVKNNM